MCLVTDTPSLTSGCILLCHRCQSKKKKKSIWFNRKDETITFNSSNILIYDFDGVISFNTYICKWETHSVHTPNLPLKNDVTVNLVFLKW